MPRTEYAIRKCLQLLFRPVWVPLPKGRTASDSYVRGPPFHSSGATILKKFAIIHPRTLTVFLHSPCMLCVLFAAQWLQGLSSLPDQGPVCKLLRELETKKVFIQRTTALWITHSASSLTGLYTKKHEPLAVKMFQSPIFFKISEWAFF